MSAYLALCLQSPVGSLLDLMLMFVGLFGSEMERKQQGALGDRNAWRVPLVMSQRAVSQDSVFFFLSCTVVHVACLCCVSLFVIMPSYLRPTGDSSRDLLRGFQHSSCCTTPCCESMLQDETRFSFSFFIQKCDDS